MVRVVTTRVFTIKLLIKIRPLEEHAVVRPEPIQLIQPLTFNKPIYFVSTRNATHSVEETRADVIQEGCGVGEHHHHGKSYYKKSHRRDTPHVAGQEAQFGPSFTQSRYGGNEESETVSVVDRI